MTDNTKKELTELIQRCLANDDDAWHELIDRISPLIFSICHKMNLSRDESFDVFGQVCVRLVKSLGTLQSPERIFSYVTSITRNQVLTFFSKAKRQNKIINESSKQETVTYGKTAEELFAEMKRNELLLEALGTLPEHEYKLIFALFLDPSEPTYEEIAQKLNIPISSIGPTRGRTLQKLYRVLKRKKFEF